MNQDDPFAGLGDGDQTIMKPSPGGISRDRPPPAPPPTAAGGSPLLPPRVGLNPLENAATTLLALFVRLQNTPSHGDPEGLRRQTIDAIKAFEHRTREAGVRPEAIAAARYVLCTALDEAVLNTPWGSTSPWRQQSLLVTFHKEAWGGEKFFLLLDKLAQDPSGNLDLLELMYLCLALGFQGRYRVMDDGRGRLEEVRERLFRTIRAQRGEFERNLSPHWEGIVDRRNPLIRHVPLWVVSAVAGVLLIGTYIGFNFSLNRASDPVFADLSAIGKNIAPPLDLSAASRTRLQETPVAPPPIPEPTIVSSGLRAFLEPEIRQRLVAVKESASGVKITISGDNLFKSASATVTKNYRPLLARIAEALKKEPGGVFVTGHTDSIPIHTVRFPSNYHLSQARAETVVKLLTTEAEDADRFGAEGRADAEPLASNKTAAGRARNRRVEIFLQPQQGGA